MNSLITYCCLSKDYFVLQYYNIFCDCFGGPIMPHMFREKPGTSREKQGQAGTSWDRVVSPRDRLGVTWDKEDFMSLIVHASSLNSFCPSQQCPSLPLLISDSFRLYNGCQSLHILCFLRIVLCHLGLFHW